MCIACDLASEDSYESLIGIVRARDGLEDSKARAKVISEFKSEMKLDSVEVVVISDEYAGSKAASVVLLGCPFSVANVLLSLVDRLLLFDKGRLVADGPKDRVLALLHGNAAKPAQPTQSIQPVKTVQPVHVASGGVRSSGAA